MVNVKCLCFHLFPCFTEVWCSTQCMGTCSKLMPMETFWCVCMGSTSWRGKVHYSHFALNWAIIQTCVFKFSLGDKNCWNLTVLSSTAQRKCCMPVFLQSTKPFAGVHQYVHWLSLLGGLLTLSLCFRGRDCGSGQYFSTSATNEFFCAEGQNSNTGAVDIFQVQLRQAGVWLQILVWWCCWAKAPRSHSVL